LQNKFKEIFFHQQNRWFMEYPATISNWCKGCKTIWNQAW